MVVTDVLFIYNDRSAHSGYTTGLGVASIAAYLRRHGVEPGLIYWRDEEVGEPLLARIRTAAPRVLGFYGPTSGFRGVRELSAAVRADQPGLFQVYGGPDATLRPGVLESTDSLDAVCVGYGERPTLELVERLARGEPVTGVPGLRVAEGAGPARTVRESPPWDWRPEGQAIFGYDHRLFLEELARFPDFDRESFNLEVMLCRGCPFSCAFCSNKALRRVCGEELFRPDPVAAVDLLEEAVGATGLRRIEIHDEVLTVDRPWFREFMAEYRRRLDVPFWCNLRPGVFGEEEARLLAECGCERVFMGVESGNDAVRNGVMKKGVQREAIVSGVDLLRRADIKVTTQNMVGLPGETPELFLDTVRLTAAIEPDAAIVSVFYPYPGTELDEVCRSQTLLAGPEEEGLAGRERTDTTLRLPDFSRRDILFYSRSFPSLVRYERLRRRRRWAAPIPLRAGTARGIAATVGMVDGLRAAAVRLSGRRRREPGPA